MEDRYNGLRIAGTNYESMVDGEGCRMTIFFSGCPHHCEGCQNPETHDPEYGKPVTEETVEGLAQEYYKRPYLTGITLSGGEPLENIKGLRNFILDFYNAYEKAYVDADEEFDEDPTLWIYTGYTWEEISEMLLNLDKLGKEGSCCLFETLLLTDVLVDGRFEQDKADKTLKFRGSSNQRIIDVYSSPFCLMDADNAHVPKELK